MSYKSNKVKLQTIKAKRKQRNNAYPTATWDKDGLLHHIPSYLEDFIANNHSSSNVTKLPMKLQEVVDEGYKLFACYSPPERFSVCLQCCVSMEEEVALRNLPLSKLPRELIYSYNTSAKAILTKNNEVGYLLPRILELISLNEMIHHSEELNLTWLSLVPRQLWSVQELNYLDRFALAYFENIVEQAQNSPFMIRLEEILIMFGRAGINIEPVLSTIAELPNIYLTTSLAMLLVDTKSINKIFTKGFATECADLNTIFNLWLARDINKLRNRSNEAILNFDNIAESTHGYDYATEQILCDLAEGKISF